MTLGGSVRKEGGEREKWWGRKEVRGGSGGHIECGADLILRTSPIQQISQWAQHNTAMASPYARVV